ncbi:MULTISPECIES: metallophosphoesterase family protein [Olivibacter]|uniref:Metallophosphoesterase family protein n=1 Tax=Olivibacter jilunii TaxID=985016 RepID=A0ABW6AV38_9SPHI
MKRSEFIRQLSSAFIAFHIPVAFGKLPRTFNKKFKIGLIADLHQDIMHDGQNRLEVFLKSVEAERPDAIMQLGDFAYPSEKNQHIINRFNQAHANALHVIGNHDTDNGHTKEACIRVWGMPARYYTKTLNGIKLIVLDGNDKGSPTHKGGYPAFIGAEQANWLKSELEKTEDPVVIISHQPLAGPAAIDNAKEIQDILSPAASKILLAINGHTHIDTAVTLGGITYVHINSASYFWAGKKYKHNSYAEAVHKDHPWIAYTFPYQTSLFTFLEVDPMTSSIKILGKKSHWQGDSPASLGYKENNLTVGNEVIPRITARNIHKQTAKIPS